MLISGFNLATSDYRTRNRRLILQGAVAAGLALLLIGQGVVWYGVRGEVQAVAPQLAKMEAEFRRHQDEVRAARAAVPAEAVKRYEAKVAVFNQILEASVFSWTGLLSELERSVPPGVTLSEIHPELATGHVALRGVAKSFDDISRMLHTLEEQSAFHDVYLLRQSVKRTAGGGPEVLEFAVTLTYKKGSQ